MKTINRDVSGHHWLFCGNLRGRAPIRASRYLIVSSRARSSRASTRSIIIHYQWPRPSTASSSGGVRGPSKADSWSQVGSSKHQVGRLTAVTPPLTYLSGTPHVLNERAPQWSITVGRGRYLETCRGAVIRGF